MILLILINIVEKTCLCGTNFFMVGLDFLYSMTIESHGSESVLEQF